MRKKKILLLEPYYGGSHKRFLDGLVRTVDGDYTLLSLPARKWKMRMQLSAPYFIERIWEMSAEKRHFDIALFSTFVDVAVFRAMAGSVEGWKDQCRYFTYFHENQFCYPGFLEKQTNHQFTAINFTTALVSDKIAFNSEFNRTAFLSQCRKYLSKATDMDLSYCLDDVQRKSIVLYPGLDFGRIDRLRQLKKKGQAKLIIWNHRWEHDKNPEEFFDTLYKLQDNGISFRLCVLGQSFANSPPCFAEARERLADKLVHFGYVEDLDSYCRYLAEGDIIVSTALHEFFGISVLEAVRAGCLPLLPKRLSYPELFDACFLYEQGCLYEHLEVLLTDNKHLSNEQAISLTETYDWKNQAAYYRDWLN